ncbi:MAG: arabinose operon protein AraL [Candidatus Latescibacterota bacterium]
MRFQGYIFDLDGTVYLGDALLPHAKETIAQLREAGRQVLFLSNKPTEDRKAYADKLSRLGIDTHVHDVINSSFVAALYFQREMPQARIFVMGESVLVEELQKVGLQMAKTPGDTDVVLISLDRQLSYEKIHFAYHAAKAGAKVWATNPDLVCPMPSDEIIDAGATIAALEALLRRPIDGVIGKPSAIMLDTVLKHLQLSPSECLMVGDRLETDILMGNLGGMATALVLTGVTRREDIDKLGIEPDYVIDSVHGVLSI